MINKEDYIQEADCQLNNHTYYQKLTADLTTKHSAEIKLFVSSMATWGLIDNKTKEFLILCQPRTEPGNPGRPIVPPTVPWQITSHVS